MEWLRAQADRDYDPSTPPWFTVRFYLAIVALLFSAYVLVFH